MQQSHLPVVMPNFGTVSIGSTTQGEKVITVPGQNIGTGPALGVRLRIELLGQYGDPSVAPQPHQEDAARTGLGTRMEASLKLQFRGLA
jgi:hypothetical protein